MLLLGYSLKTVLYEILFLVLSIYVICIILLKVELTQPSSQTGLIRDNRDKHWENNNCKLTC